MEQWIDIVPPQMPAGDGGVILYFVLGVMLLATLLALMWYYYSRPQQHAKRQLRLLIKKIHLNDIDSRSLSFELVHCLRLAFSRQRLQEVRFADTLHENWSRYLIKLNILCFSPAPPNTDDLAQALDEAVQWLKIASESD